MTNQSKVADFIEFLEELKWRQDLGALAALRRGLGRLPGSEPAMYPYVARWAGGERSRWREDVYYLVAALFAFHPMSWPKEDGRWYTNLGASFADLAGGDPRVNSERRFSALLNAHRDDLHVHLRHAMSIMKANNIPVDWFRLFHDLAGWNREDRRVQQHWANAYWGAELSSDANPGENT